MANRNDRGDVLLIMIMVIAVVAVVVFLHTRSARQENETASAPVEPPPAAKETPVPAPPEPEPAPEADLVVTAEAEPTPEPVATPEPTPKAFALADIVPDRSQWPRTVRLKKATKFPVVVGGRVAGHAEIPAGTTVQLTQLTAQWLELNHAGGRVRALPETTDLLDTMRKARGESPEAEASRPAASAEPVVSDSPVSAAASGSGGDRDVDADFPRRVKIEMVRSRKSKIEGGDDDDKIDRIRLRVTFRNSAPNLAFPDYSADLYVFGESQVEKGIYKLLSKQEKNFSLEARQNFDWDTEEIKSGWDNTDAVWGFRFTDWLVVVKSQAGKVVMAKSSSSVMQKKLERFDGLREGSGYTRELEVAAIPTR